MSTNYQQDTFSQFLSYVPGQKEIPLVIVSSDSKQQALKELEKEGFGKAGDLKELLQGIEQGGSHYFDVSADDDLKKIYDLVVQHPMNQIRMLDQKTGEEKRIAPDYSNLSVVLLLSWDVLDKFREQGFDLLSKAGITYQINQGNQ